jgi:hypothetical protein
MDTVIKFSFKELELLIEVMERNRIDNDNENKLRHELRQIRKDAEIKKNTDTEVLANKPSEEVRLNPSMSTAVDEIE